jgi:hypothetical protein
MYWIDKIMFGNPNSIQLVEMNKETYLDSLYSDLSKYNFPTNSSESTISELNELVELIKNIKDDNEWKRRYFMYDRYLIKYFKEELTDDDKEKSKISNLIDNILNDSTPLLLKLKYFFNRPRPKQLASAYNLKLFPYKSYTDDSPSFPSGHAFYAKLFCEIIGNTYPESYNEMQKLIKDICNSRKYMGLNYQSDIDMGLFFAEKALENYEFKLKYSL